MTTTHNEIAIVGAGPLGLSLALALKRHGRNVRLYDVRPNVQAHQDARVLALSHGSRQLFELLDAWPANVTPIETIHISQRDALGRTKMHAADYGIPALGYVVPAAQLMRSLTHKAASQGIETVFDARVTETHASENDITLHIRHADNTVQAATAQLIACCEGAIDPHNNPDVISRDYQQHALLCRVSTTQSQGHIAFERFTPDGPIALLPLGKDFAVVWTVSPQRLQKLQALDDATLLKELQYSFGRRITFTALHDRTSYPLGLRYRKHPTAERTVWLGNAAQTLHPVAGQGLNLALRDVWELTKALINASDAGDGHALKTYAKSRRPDRLGAIGFSDSLVRIFSNDNFVLKHGRGAALLAMDVLPPLRHFIAKRMMFGARAWP